MLVAIFPVFNLLCDDLQPLFVTSFTLAFFFDMTKFCYENHLSTGGNPIRELNNSVTYTHAM